ncbi:hypothetical protein ABIA30_003955 [Mycobacterium sp. MAA66]|uniref:hypothetical protein n=1 Tax=Mycobacterium sp. MAA66 TaxID=3156297 RepID=UPI0035113C8F
MSTVPGLVTPADRAAGTAQPRRAVIDAAWRALGPGLEVLSSADGGPLSRTVKRIIDPLVLRLRVNPHYSTPLVTAETADAMYQTIVEQAERLHAAAQWFALLKSERRRARITTGNAQELYFPVCFELSATKGAPGQGDTDTAAAVLRDVHDDRDRTAAERLTEYLSDPGVIRGLSGQLESSWCDVRAGDELAGPFLAGLSTALGPASGHTAQTARQRVWTALIADSAPYNLGARLRDEFADTPWSIVEIGLCSVAPQLPPPMLGGALTDRPLDRAVVDRVRATLRRALDRDELPGLPTLCEEEVDRAAAPWGLLAEDKQSTLVAGIELGVDLAPLQDGVVPRYQLAQQIQARLRKEAYVMHARRYLADGAPMHPRQQHVVDDLARFVRPYVARLWARLHGRDVWQEPCTDIDEVRALLDGVARSVSLDHRQRIKAMLELEAVK